MNDTIVLIDEAGVEHEFEVEAFLDVDDQRYAILVPQSEEFEDEAIIMRFGKDPAVGSSVLITAVTDSGGFLIFLGLATLILL